MCPTHSNKVSNKLYTCTTTVFNICVQIAITFIIVYLISFVKLLRIKRGKKCCTAEHAEIAIDWPSENNLLLISMCPRWNAFLLRKLQLQRAYLKLTYWIDSSNSKSIHLTSLYWCESDFVCVCLVGTQTDLKKYVALIFAPFEFHAQIALHDLFRSVKLVFVHYIYYLISFYILYIFHLLRFGRC